MKLSEAIHTGAKIRPQCRGQYFRAMDGSTIQYGSCALGAAFEAVNGELIYATGIGGGLLRQWPELAFSEKNKVINPLTQANDYLMFVISDLNDQHKMSREEIANWLKSIGY